MLSKIKSLNNQDASAYIYVLFVMLSIFIMLTVMVRITSQSVAISNAALQSSNLYHMAKGGVDKAIYLLNHVITTNEQSIHRNIVTNIQTLDLDNIVVFISEDNAHSGNFHFAEEGFYGELFKHYAKGYISNFLQEMQGTFSFNMEGYHVDVRITYNIARGHYDMVSVVTRSDMLASITLEAVVALTGDTHSQIVHENYQWRNIPPHFYSSIYDNADISQIINLEVNLYENNWLHSYPILFNRYGGLSIDISSFYSGYSPVNTVIVHNGEQDLFIYASDETRNIFRGVIISQGNIVFDAGYYIIEGSLITGGCIQYRARQDEPDYPEEDYAYLEIIPNTDILFYIDFYNKEHERKLFDSLNLTTFFRGDNDVLGSLSICSSSSVEIRIDTAFKAKLNLINERASM